jgi:hypothetical protein
MQLSIAKYGNSKVGCAIFSIVRGLTCKLGLKCLTYCYNNKTKRFKNCRPSRIRNLKASKSETFVQDMCDFLESYSGSYFRIHEEGDFYSLEYIYKCY